MPKFEIRYAIYGFLGLAFVLVALMSVYTVPEGHVGIVKRWGKAVTQVDPGLNVKVPLADSIERIEVRQRKTSEELGAATSEQLAIGASISVNWTVDRDSAMQLFVEYGGLGQFESRILIPKLRSSAKAALSGYSATELIRSRQQAVSSIMDSMVRELEGFPIRINSPQIENIILPSGYLESVEAKERAREDAEREEHRLRQQGLVAQQQVNSAKAEAEALKLVADAHAYRIKVEAEAEAEAIRKVGTEIESFPAYTVLSGIKQWDGILPGIVLGPGTNTFLPLPAPLDMTDRPHRGTGGERPER